MVDHDLEIVQILEVNLAHADLDVISAQSGAQALTKATSENPDIILLDAVLPDNESLEICRQLKESQHTGHIPVIIIGSDGEGYEGATEIINGADQYISKPFDPNEVVALVKTYFRQIERATNTSPLTELPNQAQMHAEVTSLIERNRIFAAIHVDIDDLKTFNRAYSFDHGDRAIKLVAEILREIDERRRLKGAMLLEMEEEIKKAEIALTDIEHWAIGYNHGIDLERRGWRDKIFDLRKEMRIETINCFRDVIMLRKELVEFLRQDRSILRMLKTLR